MSAVCQTESKSSSSSSIPLNRGELNRFAVEAIRDIVTDTNTRMKKAVEEIQQLKQGLFYPNEYYFLLKRHAEKGNESAQKRLAFFLNKGAFYHGYVSKAHFSQVKDPSRPTGVILCCFVLKEGVLPTTALKAAITGLSLLDCAATCELAYYKALEKAFGEETFNLLFAANGSTPLTLGHNYPRNPLRSLYSYSMAPRGTSFEEGQIVFVSNTVLYQPKHLMGEAQGFNLMCVDSSPGREKFTGLGLKEEGSTKREIVQVLIDEFNKTPVSMEIVPEKVAKAILKTYSPLELQSSERLKSMTITSFEEQAEKLKEYHMIVPRNVLGGGEFTAVCQLNASTIAALQKAKNPSELFAKSFEKYLSEEMKRELF